MPSIEQHVILTLGRSGSNTLVNLLNQHPNVLNYGEVLGDWNAIRKVYNRVPYPLKHSEARYLDTLLHNLFIARILNFYRNYSYRRRGKPNETKSFSNLKTIGVKEFSFNLNRRQLSEFLAARPHIKVIGLTRDDVLDRFISWKMLEQTGVIKLDRTDGGSQRQIILDPDTLIQELQNIEAENRSLAQMLDSLPASRLYHVSYDGLYGGQEQTQAILDEIIRFLDLPPFVPEIRMRKIIQGKPLESIRNLAACQATVRGTEFESLFTDPRLAL